MRDYKYEEIENDILEKIKNKVYGPGSQIPTEKELCEFYNTSRTTVRKALQDLVNRGLLIRKSAIGTYVNSFNIVNSSGKAQSFTQDMLSNNKIPGSVIIEFMLMTAENNLEISRILNLKENDLFYKIVRLRTGDDLPIALSYTYIPYTILPNLKKEMLNDSLYEIIKKKYGQNIVKSTKKRTIAAVMPTNYQKAILKISNEPLLKVSHDSYLENGVVYEYSETYYIGSRFIYTYINS